MARVSFEAAATARRLVSLDLLRGLAVMGMILANATAGMFYDNKATVFSTLIHEHWEGLHLADTVFPAFLLMVGVAIPMSLARVKAAGAVDGDAVRRLVRRGLRLFVIGLLLSNLGWFASFSHGSWRFWGVLQRIGIVYVACGVLFLQAGRRTWCVVAAAALIAYWLLLLVPLPDGQPTDLWVRGLNWGAWLDRVTLGDAHIYVHGPQGYDPEGLLGTLPAVAHGLIGVLVGDLLLRQPGRRSSVALASLGAALLVAGLLWGFWFPIVKDLWSSSFVLVTCGLTILVLAALHAAVDGRDGPLGQVWSIPLAFGGNAIAAYVLHEVTASMLRWDLILLPYRLLLPHVSAPFASLAPVILYMALIWSAMQWLRRRGWTIKV